MNIFQTLTIFFITLILSYQYSKIVKVRRKRALKLFLWHTIFCAIYIKFAIDQDLDALGYFYNSINYIHTSFVSNDFILLITSVFSKYLGFNFVSCSLIYNFIGVIGVITMDAIIAPIAKETTPITKFLSELLIWSPTLHFWTSSISKDAIVFTSINLIVYSLIEPRKRFLLLFPCFLLVSACRPYIGIVLFSSIITALFSKIDIPRNYKITLRLVAILLFSSIFSFGVAQFSFRSDISIQSVTSLLEYHRTVTEVGTTSVDMNSLSIPMRFFTYMFRPLFFDATGLLGIFASFDNLILLSYFVYPIMICFSLQKIPKPKLNSVNLFSLIYVSITWFFLSSTTSNLGLALRHKLMFITPFVFLMINFSKVLKARKNSNQY